MLIGISGPIQLSFFAEFLSSADGLDTPMPVGLGGTAVNLIAKGLLAKGHELVIFTLDTSVNREVVLDGPQLRICVGPYRPRARFRAMDMFRAERNYIANAAIRERPDIIHAHWTYEFAAGALDSGIPTLVTVRDWAPKILSYYRNMYRFIRFLMDWQTFRKAKYLSANSYYIQKLILNRFRINVPVIPNPIEDSFLQQTQKKYKSDSPTIISVNNEMSDHKNVKNLIIAFKHIRQSLPGCRLKLVGNEFGPNQLAEQWSKSSGLDDGIDFLGSLQRQDLKKVLEEADLLIHPSLEESFGNTLIEAMALRLPVIGGMNSGAVPWILDDGSAGMLCDVKSPRQIAQTAIDVLVSEDQWQRYSESGYERIVDQFSIEKVVDTCIEQYRRILSY